MKKIWPYISTLLVGVVLGILLWEKVDVKAIYNGKVKIKQKGKGNEMANDIELTVEEAKETIKKVRKEKREARKAKREERRQK